MSRLRVVNFSISLDGFGTGEGQSFDEPFGHAGERLHEWMVATQFGATMFGAERGTSGVDDAYAQRHSVGFGAEIMGRRKFTPEQGPWQHLGTDQEWQGWWGANPPFHAPVFVLTHHPRPSLELDGGNVFHFIDASPAEALAQARAAAGGLDVRLGGGPSTVREFLAADLVDDMHLVVVPIVLGRGVRLWDGLEGLEQRFDIETVASPTGVVHMTFERRRT